MPVTRVFNTFDDTRRLLVDGKVVATLPPGKSTCVHLEIGQVVDFIRMDQELPEASEPVRRRSRKTA